MPTYCILRDLTALLVHITATIDRTLFAAALILAMASQPSTLVAAIGSERHEPGNNLTTVELVQWLLNA
jgi:hypothetical protein